MFILLCSFAVRLTGPDEDHRTPCFGGEVVVVEVLAEMGGLVLCDRETFKYIIARILHALTSTSRQKVDAARAKLGG
jgi:hypothetical protein